MHRLCVFVNLFFIFPIYTLKKKAGRILLIASFPAFFTFLLFFSLHILQNPNPSIRIRPFLLHYFFRCIYFKTQIRLYAYVLFSYIISSAAYTSKPESVYPHTLFSLTLFLPLHILRNQSLSVYAVFYRILFPEIWEAV